MPLNSAKFSDKQLGKLHCYPYRKRTIPKDDHLKLQCVHKVHKIHCHELAKRILQASYMPLINRLVRSNYDRIQTFSVKFQHQFWKHTSVRPFVQSETGIIPSFCNMLHKKR